MRHQNTPSLLVLSVHVLRRGRLRLVWLVEILVAVVSIGYYYLLPRIPPLVRAWKVDGRFLLFFGGVLTGVTLQLLLFSSSHNARGGAHEATVALHTSVPQSQGLAPNGRTAQVAAALANMDARDLSLTFARIHYAFEAVLTDGHYNIAAGLLAYAELAENELKRRNIELPEQVASPAGMRMLLDVMR
jgi:hypothetical protein